MGNSITIGITFVFLFIIGIIILWTKYSADVEPKLIIKLKLVPLSSIFLFSILVVFSVVLLVSYIRSPFNYPRISDISSEYNDMIDVGDGVIVVGRTRLSVRDPNELSHSYDTTRAYIVKYDYDGELIWDDVYYVEENVELSSIFNLVEVDNDGNIVASGTFGGYYDGYSWWSVIYNSNGEVLDQKNISYNEYTLLPFEINNASVLSTEFEVIDYDTRTYGVLLKLESTENNTNIEYELIYQHEVITDYNTWQPRVSVIYSDDDVFVVGVTAFDMREVLVFNKTFVFDYNLNLVSEVDLSEDIVAGKIKLVNNEFYMISRNDVNRVSHLVLLNSDFSEKKYVKIQTNLDYFLVNDIEFKGDLIYVGGNEYETRVKEGFVEYFSGAIITYNSNLELQGQMFTQKGVGINSFLLINDNIYTTGLYNTSIGLASMKNQTAWCGVFSVINNKNQNYLLAFPHQKVE